MGQQHRDRGAALRRASATPTTTARRGTRTPRPGRGRRAARRWPAGSARRRTCSPAPGRAGPRPRPGPGTRRRSAAGTGSSTARRSAGPSGWRSGSRSAASARRWGRRRGRSGRRSVGATVGAVGSGAGPGVVGSGSGGSTGDTTGAAEASGAVVGGRRPADAPAAHPASSRPAPSRARAPVRATAQPRGGVWRLRSCSAGVCPYPSPSAAAPAPSWLPPSRRAETRHLGARGRSRCVTGPAGRPARPWSGPEARGVGPRETSRSCGGGPYRHPGRAARAVRRPARGRPGDHERRGDGGVGRGGPRRRAPHRLPVGGARRAPRRRSPRSRRACRWRCPAATRRRPPRWPTPSWPEGADVVGVSGPVGAARAFARRWTDRTGTTVVESMAQGVYVCDDVVPPDGVPGRPGRRSRRTRRWSPAGCTTSPSRPVSTPPRPAWSTPCSPSAGSACGSSSAVDGDVTDRAAGVVSMLAVRTSPAGMARIGPVWTPPERRRHGYASALTADVTARARPRPPRDALHRPANPTSNGIYQAVGYRRVGDAVVLRF